MGGTECCTLPGFTKKDADFVRATELCEKFAKKEGRQPRIMIAKMGQDGHGGDQRQDERHGPEACEGYQNTAAPRSP